jgi:hypothetical protein
VFADLSGISGTGAVWADFGGTIGKVVDTSGTSINGATLKEAIRRGQIITVHRGSDGSHPTLVAEKVENPADLGSSLTLDALKDVDTGSAAVGSILTKMPNGTWMGRPNAISSLNSLTDVAAPANTPAGKVLGTTAVGAWGPVDLDSRLAALEARIAALEAP